MKCILSCLTIATLTVTLAPPAKAQFEYLTQAERRFIVEVSRTNPEMAKEVDVDTALYFAHASCFYFNAGATYPGAMSILAQNSAANATDPAQAKQLFNGMRNIMHVAVSHLCPENLGVLPR
jgi:hypothetical protein